MNYVLRQEEDRPWGSSVAEAAGVRGVAFRRNYPCPLRIRQIAVVYLTTS
jgi:hypothetical protein